MIEVSHATVAFGSGRHRLEAVRDVSFRVERSDSFGLVGESGCGKSTLLRAIAGLLPLTSGHIAIAERQLAARRTKEEHRLTQMVFQDPFGSLNPTHTVDRILSEPLAIQKLDNVSSRVARALQEVGMGLEHRYRYPHQISGGQRQRVAIARALIVEPPVLLLDEPTSALDLSVQAEILNLLKQIRRSHGLTMLMVSHDLAVISHMCTRIAVMHRGEVVEILPVEALRQGRADHAYTRALLGASLEATHARAIPSSVTLSSFGLARPASS